MKPLSIYFFQGNAQSILQHGAGRRAHPTRQHTNTPQPGAHLREGHEERSPHSASHRTAADNQALCQDSDPARPIFILCADRFTLRDRSLLRHISLLTEKSLLLKSVHVENVGLLFVPTTILTSSFHPEKETMFKEGIEHIIWPNDFLIIKNRHLEDTLLRHKCAPPNSSELPGCVFVTASA